MGLFDRFRRKPDNLAHFAELAEESGDISSAVSMAMSGLEPSQQIEIALRLASLMPAKARVALFGNTLAKADEALWQKTMQTLDSRERRILTVDALREESHHTHAVDLGQLVMGTQVTIRLKYTGSGGLTPFPTVELYRAGTQLYDGGEVHLESLGGNEFVTLRPLSFYQPDSYPYDCIRYPENSVVLLQSSHARKEPASNVRFGDQVQITSAENDPDWQHITNLTYNHKDVAKYNGMVKVGGMMLDGVSMFY
ncbi:MAG TPA: hypothetical protein VF733_06900 [Candidatus Saccharimonadales bacterium]